MTGCMKLKQTASVFEYRNNFETCAFRAGVSDELLVHLWVKGLQPEIRLHAGLDRLSCKAWTSVKDAQQAAMVYDFDTEYAITTEDDYTQHQSQVPRRRRMSRSQRQARQRANKRYILKWQVSTTHSLFRSTGNLATVSDLFSA